MPRHPPKALYSLIKNRSFPSSPFLSSIETSIRHLSRILAIRILKEIFLSAGYSFVKEQGSLSLPEHWIAGQTDGIDLSSIEKTYPLELP